MFGAKAESTGRQQSPFLLPWPPRPIETVPARWCPHHRIDKYPKSANALAHRVFKHSSRLSCCRPTDTLQHFTRCPLARCCCDAVILGSFVQGRSVSCGGQTLWVDGIPSHTHHPGTLAYPHVPSRILTHPYASSRIQTLSPLATSCPAAQLFLAMQKSVNACRVIGDATTSKHPAVTRCHSTALRPTLCSELVIRCSMHQAQRCRRRTLIVRGRCQEPPVMASCVPDGKIPAQDSRMACQSLFKEPSNCGGMGNRIQGIDASTGFGKGATHSQLSESTSSIRVRSSWGTPKIPTSDHRQCRGWCAQLHIHSVMRAATAGIPNDVAPHDARHRAIKCLTKLARAARC
ncbi:hypothetical protein EDB81DRAFT_437697 [Dactylonectria macrodidyma]|uniref:Uncharacterized protein n=1 Tax=Dactylonectria macrodidyma TaxID=307937 RepID=A0A9P9F5Z1_9HYPO|nr:hypothetical protein EDB81DRAFT_437697 [Dactylonectria macrodidyma]